MDSIQDMFQKGLATTERKANFVKWSMIGGEADRADTTIWNCLDSCLCSRKALQVKYMICTRYVFNYGSVN